MILHLCWAIHPFYSLYTPLGCSGRTYLRWLDRRPPYEQRPSLDFDRLCCEWLRSTPAAAGRPAGGRYRLQMHYLYPKRAAAAGGGRPLQPAETSPPTIPDPCRELQSPAASRQQPRHRTPTGRQPPPGRRTLADAGSPSILAQLPWLPPDALDHDDNQTSKCTYDVTFSVRHTCRLVSFHIASCKKWRPLEMSACFSLEVITCKD